MRGEESGGEGREQGSIAGSGQGLLLSINILTKYLIVDDFGYSFGMRSPLM